MAFTHNSKLAKHEPTWGSVDKNALPDIAFARKGTKESRGFPHHFVSGGKNKNAEGEWTDGTLYLHKGGLNAAWSAAHGARSGKPASSGVVAHLRAHFSALGIKKAELAAMFPDMDIAAIDAELVAEGLLTQEQLEQPDLAAKVSYLVQCAAGCSCSRGE